jgi:muconate cycloisomerase
VVSADRGLPFYKTLLKIMFYGIRQIKLKVDNEFGLEAARTLKRFLWRNVDIRVDANMAWSKEEAAEKMIAFSQYGISSFEQPVPSDRLDEMSWLVKKTGLGIMADESVNDHNSLSELIDKKACTAVNLRISKCGGLMAVIERCREAIDAGLVVQIGCQVGESSLLSAAQLALIDQVPEVAYLEGCYGLLLLKEDPVKPLLQFGLGGRPPERTKGPGLGVEVDEVSLQRWMKKQASIA